MGAYGKAIVYHEKHLQMAKEIGDRAGEGAAHGCLGNIQPSMGDYRKAIDCHEKRLKIAIGIGDQAREGRAYGHTGEAYR